MRARAARLRNSTNKGTRDYLSVSAFARPPRRDEQRNMSGARPPHDWPAYNAAVAEQPPSDLLVQAVETFAGEGTGPRHAVDLGCGHGRDALELLRRGWTVTAIDLTAESLDRLRTRAGPDPRLTTIHAAMEDATWPHADLVNASRALPFCAPDRFDELWARIAASLAPGGRFAGHLFGPKLSWASEVVTHTREAALDLLAGFDVERFDERESDGTGALGRPQHTHAFFIVARKR